MTLVVTGRSNTVSTVPLRSLPSGLDGLDALDDRALVEAAKHDPIAFGALYRRHVDAVFRFAHRACGGNRSVAEDVTSATFERAMGAMGSFEWRGGGIRPWLLRIASAEVANWYRAHDRSAGDRGQAAARGLLLVGAGDDAWREGDRERVLGALANLSDRYRDAITLRFLTGLTADEAAEAMECSKATFAVVLHRALTSLRREIGRQP